MDVTEIKLVIEAALLASSRPLTVDKLVELFARKGEAPERAVIREALDALAADYAERGIELKEVSSGFRIQVRSSMADWLQPLWEERAPRYTRALLETLALIAYRQPITRGEIEEVRGVTVSSNIVRTLMERGWVRVVGHRDVPGKPAMLGTTREFLDYFGLRKLEELPALAEFDEEPQLSPQGDFLDSLGSGDMQEAEVAETTQAAATQNAVASVAGPDGEPGVDFPPGPEETADVPEEEAEDWVPERDGAAEPVAVEGDEDVPEFPSDAYETAEVHQHPAAPREQDPRGEDGQAAVLETGEGEERDGSEASAPREAEDATDEATPSNEQGAMKRSGPGGF